MKRFLFIAGILLAVLALFAACGEDGSTGIPEIDSLISAHDGAESTQPTTTDTVITEAPKTLTVTFNSNGGSEVAVQSVEKGEKVGKPADPEKVGYTFSGWTYQGETWSFIGYSVTQDITLEAKWDAVFTIFENTISGLTDAGKQLKTIQIPNEIDGVAITSIGDYAFSGCSNLTSVTIPDSVTSIGSFAFENCERLIEVHNLSSFEITAGNRDYGYVGFYAKHIYSSGESYLHTINDGYVFYDDGTEVYLVAYTGNQTELTLPANYNGKNYAIYQYAFSGCSSLTNITIPNSVTSIGNQAFSSCSSLTSVTIPDSVTSIGYRVFDCCISLTSVTIGNGVTSIGMAIFSFCDKLTSVIFANTSGWYVTGTKGASNGTNMTVTDASTNATNLKSEYVAYYWYRR